jgi:predicted nucleic acid-binding protein
VKKTLLPVVEDHHLLRTAALEKCRQPLNLSLADCFAIALARRQNGLLLTTDGELSKVNDIDVKWFEV